MAYVFIGITNEYTLQNIVLILQNLGSLPQITEDFSQKNGDFSPCISQ
jgi:hypothetical protein